MSAKLVTLVLLKIKVLRNKGCQVIISVHDITKKIVLRDSNYTGDVFMLPMFLSSSISVIKVIITSISSGFGQRVGQCEKTVTTV